MYIQWLFNIPIFNMYCTMFCNLVCILEANDSYTLTPSHTPNLEMLSHLKIKNQKLTWYLRLGKRQVLCYLSFQRTSEILYLYLWFSWNIFGHKKQKFAKKFPIPLYLNSKKPDCLILSSYLIIFLTPAVITFTA